MEDNKREKTFRCGVIYGCESSSGGGKIVFGEDGVFIHGGIFHDAAYSAAYSEIKTAYYSTLLPKMKFTLSGGGCIPLKLSLRHTQLNGILRLLRRHGVPVRKMPFLPGIGGWWNCWYGE
jgi:hypothetical protein